MDLFDWELEQVSLWNFQTGSLTTLRREVSWQYCVLHLYFKLNIKCEMPHSHLIYSLYLVYSLHLVYISVGGKKVISRACFFLVYPWNMQHMLNEFKFLVGRGFFVFSAAPAIPSESVLPECITRAFLLPWDNKDEIKATVSELLYFKSRRLNLSWSK